MSYSLFRKKPSTRIDTTRGGNGRVEYAVSSMQGYRPSMEDAHAAIENLDNSPATSFFAVYDGHGGPAVAQFCASHFHNEVLSHPEYPTNLEIAVERAFFRMDELLREKEARLELADCSGKDYYEYEPITDWKDFFLNCSILKRYYRGPVDEGSTACVALIRDNVIIVGNAGDSRCVLSKNGVAIDLSIDHKPKIRNEAQRINKAGHTIRFLGQAHRIDGNIAVSRAIGDEKYKNNQELPPQEQAVTCAPDIISEHITADTEFLVIACDGIWDVMSSQEVVGFVRNRISIPGLTLGYICQDLLQTCLTVKRSTDNMTVVLVRFVHAPALQLSKIAPASQLSKIAEDDEIIEEDGSKNKGKRVVGGDGTSSSTRNADH